MTIRSVLCALAATAAATVFADVTSNVCGLLKITSDLNNTIIGVPWVEVGTGADVKVAKLVKTDNLTEGDTLYYSYEIQTGEPITYSIRPVSVIILDSRYADKAVLLTPAE